MRRIETINPSELNANDDQGGWLDDENVEGLVAAIEAGTVLPPVVAIRENRMIVEGHHRVAAAKAAGRDVRVIFIDRAEFDELRADGYGLDEIEDAVTC